MLVKEGRDAELERIRKRLLTGTKKIKRGPRPKHSTIDGPTLHDFDPSRPLHGDRLGVWQVRRVLDVP